MSTRWNEETSVKPIDVLAAPLNLVALHHGYTWKEFTGDESERSGVIRHYVPSREATRSNKQQLVERAAARLTQAGYLVSIHGFDLYVMP